MYGGVDCERAAEERRSKSVLVPMKEVVWMLAKLRWSMRAISVLGFDWKPGGERARSQER